MIKAHAFQIVENELLYGPGRRLLLFLQGCSIHCEGCVNQHLWPFEGGTTYSLNDIESLCKQEQVVGITLHGGEPLDQSNGLLEIVSALKHKGLSIVLFTGYQKKELKHEQRKVWDEADIVVSGRFVSIKKNVYLQFRGSTNQRVYTHKGIYKNYRLIDGTTTAIVTIDADGTISAKGFLTEDILRLTDDN